MAITRGYYGVLAVAGVIALVTQLPGVLLMALVLFVLPGLVLLFGSNLFIYMLTLLPVLWVLTAAKRRWVLLIPALMPVAAMAWLPKEYADRTYGALEAELVREDVSRPAALAPTSVAIMGDAMQQGCSVLCEKLLFEGHVRAVTIGGARFRVEARKTCPEMAGANRRLQMHAASGRCLLSESVAGWNNNAADVVVRAEDLARSGELSQFRIAEENRYDPFFLEKAMRYEIYEAGQLAERRTEVIGATVSAPLLISGASQRGSLNGFVSFARAKRGPKPETVEAMLQRRYGWELVGAQPPEGGSYGANEAPVDPAVFADILARSLKSDAELGDADSYALVQGARQVLAKPVLAPADFEQLRAVMQLGQLRKHAYFPNQSRRWNSQLDVLIPDAVKRLEMPYAKDDWFAGNMFGFLAAAPRDLVRPYAGRIEAVLRTQRGERADALLRVWPEISADPVPVLALWTRTRDGDELGTSDLLEGALVGMCRAAEPGRADVADAFRDFFANEFSRNTSHYQAWAAVAGLAHAAGVEEVRRVTAYPDEQRRKTMERPFRIAMEKPWPANCARY